jgi:hypothetical protein
VPVNSAHRKPITRKGAFASVRLEVPNLHAAIVATRCELAVGWRKATTSESRPIHPVQPDATDGVVVRGDGALALVGVPILDDALFVAGDKPEAASHPSEALDGDLLRLVSVSKRRGGGGVERVLRSGRFVQN